MQVTNLKSCSTGDQLARAEVPATLSPVQPSARAHPTVAAAIALVCLCLGGVLAGCAPSPVVEPAPPPVPLPASTSVATPVPTSVPNSPPPPAGKAPPGSSDDGRPPEVISHGPSDRPWIALTFDSNMTDAMLQRLDTGQVSSYASPDVLAELQRTHTPATFFLASKWVQRYPELTRQIAADPTFELASHSYAHVGFTDHCYDLGSLPPGEMAADVERSFEVLAPFGGRQTRYFRFPGGCYDDRALDRKSVV